MPGPNRTNFIKDRETLRAQRLAASASAPKATRSASSLTRCRCSTRTSVRDPDAAEGAVSKRYEKPPCDPVRMMRVPLQSIRGETSSQTKVLGRLVVLDELDRQARIFHASFLDAMKAGDSNDADGALRHIQSALFAGIVVDRTLRQNGKIRSALGIVSNPQRLKTMRTVRDHMEHFDERLSRVVKSPNTLMIVDWYLTDGVLATSSPDALGQGGRAFSATAGLLFYDNAVVDMFELDIDMLELVQSVREFRKALRRELTGRAQFGGSQINLIAPERASARAKWESDLAALPAALSDAPLGDPAVRMWMQVETPPQGD